MTTAAVGPARPAADVDGGAPFGSRLRAWRRARRLSQLDLALAAATTSRHLSFLETGRSRPSREMVGRLSAALDLPLRARNDLLADAGFGPAFPETTLAAADLAPFRAAIDRLLAQHEPFPAFVVDGRWDVVGANRAAAALLGGDDVAPPDDDAPPAGAPNLVRLMYAGAWRPLLANWETLAPVGVRRLEEDVQRHPGDPALRDLLALATAACADLRVPPDAGGERVLCPHFRFGDTVVRTVSVVARFGSPRDVTLEELRVELVFPADDVAEDFFRTAATAVRSAQDAGA